MSNCKQFVKMEIAQSSLVDISNGVCQVSVLGLLLFIMYINDLPKASAFYIVLYANDTLYYMLMNDTYMLMIMLFSVSYVSSMNCSAVKLEKSCLNWASVFTF